MAASVILSTTFSPTYRPSLLTSSSYNSISKRKQSSQCSSNFPRWNSKPLSFSRKFVSHSSTRDKDSSIVGEDSATFDLGKQKISSWIYFTVILGVVLFVLNVAWINNSTGFGKALVDAISELSNSHEVVMLVLILIFAVVHSGLASLRNTGEKLIGERAFRVLFAGVSLPLAVTTIVYFINHRYDGLQLWQLQSTPGIHQLVWLSNFISFFFLYPSTFNLLEIAAVEKPKLHIWETGIIRITRHPQINFNQFHIQPMTRVSEIQIRKHEYSGDFYSVTFVGIKLFYAIHLGDVSLFASFMFLALLNLYYHRCNLSI